MKEDTIGHLIDAADELDPTPSGRADLRAAAELRTCNGTTVAGGHVAHSRRCPVHGEPLTPWDPNDPSTARHTDADLAAAEARGYRKAITALRDTELFARWMRAQVEPRSSVGAALRDVCADYLEAIAEEDK